MGFNSGFKGLTRLQINVFRYFSSPFPRRCTAVDTDPLQSSFSQIGTLMHIRALRFPAPLPIQNILHWKFNDSFSSYMSKFLFLAKNHVFNFIRPDVFHIKTKYNLFRLTHL